MSTKFLTVLVLLCLCFPVSSEPAKDKPSVTKSSPVHHSINYIEFSVSDMAQAQKFYADAFGWKFTDYAPGYAGIQGEQGEVGGFTVGEVRPGGVLVILFSRDLDDSLKRVREAGGTVTKEPFDFPGGRRFQFLDPSGNELAVWALPE